MERLSQEPLFVMSMSGSAIVLFYIFTYPFAKRYLSLKWRYRILKLSLFFYLIPVHQLKFIMIWGIQVAFPNMNLKGNIPEEVWLYEQQNSIFFDGSFHYGIFDFLRGAYYLIFSCIALFLVLYQLSLYIKFKHICFQYADSALLPEELCLKKLLREFKITKVPVLIHTETCKMPMAIGVIRPIIILPKTIWGVYSETIKECIIKHELIHIKNQDILIKYLGLLAVILHYFNPLSYVLYREIGVISELFCDSEVIKNYDDSVRKEYSNLLVDLSTKEKPTIKERLSSCLANNDYITLKRRITEMKSMKKGKRLMAGITFFLALTSGIIVSYAYVPPKELVIDQYEISCNYVWIPKQLADIKISSIPFGYFWIDEKGAFHEINSKDYDERVICKHDYEENGEIAIHKKESNGGCSITYKKAKVCNRCGKTIAGSTIRTTTYTVCTH